MAKTRPAGVVRPKKSAKKERLLAYRCVVCDARLKRWKKSCQRPECLAALKASRQAAYYARKVIAKRLSTVSDGDCTWCQALKSEALFIGRSCRSCNRARCRRKCSRCSAPRSALGCVRCDRQPPGVVRLVLENDHDLREKVVWRRKRLADHRGWYQIHVCGQRKIRVGRKAREIFLRLPLATWIKVRI